MNRHDDDPKYDRKNEPNVPYDLLPSRSYDNGHEDGENLPHACANAGLVRGLLPAGAAHPRWHVDELGADASPRRFSPPDDVFLAPPLPVVVSFRRTPLPPSDAVLLLLLPADGDVLLPLPVDGAALLPLPSADDIVFFFVLLTTLHPGIFLIFFANESFGALLLFRSGRVAEMRADLLSAVKVDESQMKFAMSNRRARRTNMRGKGFPSETGIRAVKLVREIGEFRIASELLL